MKRESDKCLLKGDHPIGVDNVMYKLKVKKKVKRRSRWPFNFIHANFNLVHHPSMKTGHMTLGIRKSKQKDLTVYIQ